MRYFVDAYNLLFSLAEEDELPFQESREDLIRTLSEGVEHLDLRVTLVFDAQYKSGAGGRGYHGVMEVIYTDQGQDADTFILEEIQRMPTAGDVVVVTEDRELRSHARGLGARTASTENFLKKLRAGSKGTTKVPRKAKTEKKMQQSVPNEEKEYLRVFEERLGRKHKNARPSDTELRNETELERLLRLFQKRYRE